MQELYDRMEANLIASWEAYAVGLDAAFVRRGDGVAIALFPEPPERAIYNNAVVARRLGAPGAADALDAVEAAYGQAGIAGYAVWAHESEASAISLLESRGYRIDTTTRAMAMPLDAIPVPRPRAGVRTASWHEYLRILTLLGAPPGILASVDTTAFSVRVGVVAGETVAASLAFDHGGDCGVYNVGTMPRARGRGLGTAVTAIQLHEARDRGFTTASLQATAMAERMYGELGFVDLGRFVEYVRPPG